MPRARTEGGPFTCTRCGREGAGHSYVQAANGGWRCRWESACLRRMIRKASPGAVKGHRATYHAYATGIVAECSCGASSPPYKGWVGDIWLGEFYAQLWHAEHRRRVIEAMGEQLAVQP